MGSKGGHPAQARVCKWSQTAYRGSNVLAESWAMGQVPGGRQNVLGRSLKRDSAHPLFHLYGGNRITMTSG